MACPWESTLYVESHYSAFSSRPKCPECFDLRALRVLRKAGPTAAVVALAVVAVALFVARLPWFPALLVLAPPIAVDRLLLPLAAADVPPLAALPELGLVGWSRPSF